MRDLGQGHDWNSRATAINDDGCMHDLNDLVEPTDLVLVEPRAINDDGVIIASARTQRGVYHAVALLPADPP